MKGILIITFASVISIFSSVAYSQTFQRVEISGKEKSQGLLFKFQKKYPEKVEKLELYSNGTFFYEKIRMGGNSFSRGKWFREKGNFVLSSLISKNNVPVKVKFTYDTSLIGEEFKVDIVRSLKGDPMVDAMICINTDSLRCIPLGESTKEIDSVTKIKLLFGNGLASKWTTAPKTKFNVISITVESDFDLSTYQPFDGKYKNLNKSFIEIR